MASKYPRMDCEEFGRALLETRDLDPEYVAIYEATLDGDTLSRLLLGFWFFYHAGSAAWVAEKKDDAFWSRCRDTQIPRCSQRRHFRGQAAFDTYAWFQAKYRTPERAVWSVLERSGGSYKGAMDAVAVWPQFGPMVAWKAADMIETSGLQGLVMSADALSFYEGPREGARRYSPDTDVLVAANRLLARLGPIPAPPRYTRPIGLQEAETIFCKWKSHLDGRYPVGQDTVGLFAELKWATDRGSVIATRLRDAFNRALLNP